MPALDIALVCVVVVLLLAFALILARQRFMLRAPGGIPVALSYPRAAADGGRPANWQYGIGRFTGGELRWYRSLGLGTRPSLVLHRREMQVVNRRAPLQSERDAVPASAVVVECRAGGRPLLLALGEGAYFGFVSWLESSAPLS